MKAMAAGPSDPSARMPALPFPTTVAVVDGRMSGHHTAYLRLITRMLLELGARVLLLCPEPREVETWLAARADQRDLAERLASASFRLPRPSRPPVGRLAGLAAYLGRWQAVARAIRGQGTRPRLVLFPWLDDFLTSARYISLISPWLLPLVFRHPWAGIFFRPHRIVVPRLGGGPPARHPYSALRLASCKRVFLLDEARLAILAQGRVGNRARRCPDFTDESPPTDDYPLLDELRERARGRAVVSVLGGLTRRKGVLTLLEVALTHREAPWFFLFAGELMEQHFSVDELERIRRLAVDPPENCHFACEYIPDEPSFNALVEASSVVYAAYQGFQNSSNILTKAALFEKPVIVSDGYLMADRVRRFKLGACIAQDSAAECGAALEVVSDPERFRREVGEARFGDYLRSNSSDILRAEFSELLGGRRRS